MATLKATELGLKQAISTAKGTIVLKDATQEQLQGLINHKPAIKKIELLIVEETATAPVKSK